jgi:hypothetical protein
MKLSGFLGCLLAVAPLGLAAQSGSQSYGAITTIGPNGQVTSQTFTVPNPCPVSMQATHGSDGTMIKTGPTHPKDAHSTGIGQQLHLTLRSPDQRIIASATVNVRGWTAKGRIAHADTGNDSALAVRTLTAPFAAGPNRSASADLRAPGLTSISSVELVSVTFTNGTTWTPAQGKTCRVSPDPMMLIANH